MASFVFQLGALASFVYSGVFACDVDKVDACQQAFADATNNQSIKNTGAHFDCDVVVPAMQTYRSCVLDASDGCFEGMVPVAREAMETMQMKYAEQCSELKIVLKQVIDCKPAEVTQNVYDCQPPLNKELEAIADAVDCSAAQDAMGTYRSCIENSTKSLVSGAECGGLLDSIYDVVKSQENNFGTQCLNMKSQMEKCKPLELIKCLNTYVTEFKAEISEADKTEQASTALCSAKEKLQTCIDEVAPDCDASVKKPAQQALFEAEEKSPESVCGKQLAHANGLRAPIIFSMMLGVVQSFH